MTLKEFLNVVLQASNQYLQAVQTGAQWEIAAQAFICMKLMEAYRTMGRELPYPDTKQSVDIAFQLNNQLHIVELKVESAVNAGKFAGASMNVALQTDVNKIRTFVGGGDSPAPSHRWVVVLAYSAQEKKRIETAAGTGKFNAIDTEGPFMAGIIDVDNNTQW